MRLNPRSWPNAALLIGAAATGFIAGNSGAGESAVRLISGSETVVRGIAVSCNIKGNISASGERIYHVPGQRYYGETSISGIYGERYFCTEREARQAGWRRSKL